MNVTSDFGLPSRTEQIKGSINAKVVDALTVSAVINGVYYPSIDKSELVSLSSSDFSSGAQSNDRRRQYEDYAQDTVQPYDAAGKPRPEFYRLYPDKAPKVFTKAEIEQVKRTL